MEPFVHLHIHTEYSLLDGANRISDLVQAAVDDGHESLAITDKGNLFGAMEFYKACTKAAVKPILGCEMSIAENSLHEPHSRKDNPLTQLTLLARNAKGWKNLHKLSSYGYLEGVHSRPHIDMELLAKHAEGITCLSGGIFGPVNRTLRNGDLNGAQAEAGRLQDIFGKDHFYLEIMRNGLDSQDRCNESMVAIKDLTGAPLVATNDVHYLRHEDCHTQDAMLCIATGAKIDNPDRLRMEADTLFFRSREQMNRIFSDIPEALRNTVQVAEQINVEVEFGKYRLPHFVPPDKLSTDDYFRKLCEEGFARYYPGNPLEARERLEYEMRVISEMGFVTYFLITWDLIAHARRVGIPVGPGRGSAAGSIVAYVLEITRLDPLEYDLIFERFLNPGRVSMPDIDIDFCKDRREEMIQYTRQKYGDDRVCQIITFGKMKARAALRDVARVMDIPLNEVDQLVKKVPEGPGVKLKEAFDGDPELQELRDSTQQYQRWVGLATAIEGMARHTSVHAAGVIIGDEPLIDIAPLAKQDDIITTQWDMKYSEEFGLLKMDFLGLRTLSILAETVRLVKQRHEVEINLEELPLDDEATYKLLQAGDTEGVFQLESGGMRRLLANLKPSSYEDVVAVLALYRPGPLGSGLHDVYASRKHGREKVRFPHPLLEEILKETYGVLIYQEQIMRVAQRMGGFSLPEADALRKAMGKKDAKLMGEFEPKFLEGAVTAQVPHHIAQDIWDMMAKFAEYGFNKSHSAAYALVTYQAAWMKAHYPEEFFASNFTYEASDTDKLATLIEDAKGHNLTVLPPSIQESEVRFAVTPDDCIRFGLEAIRGVGTGAAEAIVQAREARQNDGQRFPNADEFYIDCVVHGVNKTTMESLVKAGALEDMPAHRLDQLDELPTALAQAQSVAKDRARGQSLLFDAIPHAPAASSDPSADTSNLRPLSDEELRFTMSLEKDALGLYLTKHPLDPYREILRGVTPWDSRNVKEVGDGAKVTLAGIATHVQVRATRKDPSKKMGWLRVEDLYGSVSTIGWPSTLENCRDCVEEDFIGLFHGTLALDGEEPTLKVDMIEPLGERGEIRLKGSLDILLPANEPPIELLQEILRAHHGNSPVRFLYADENGKRVGMRAGPAWRVNLSANLFDELNRLLAPEGRAIAVGEKKQIEREEEPHWKRRDP
ncbi:MAG: DNA polymerase III subunit alpha [Planctomycetes bacterium]|nr:DNA polymerase III subunit alpha [Planctomycetota bacterium]